MLQRMKHIVVFYAFVLILDALIGVGVYLLEARLGGPWAIGDNETIARWRSWELGLRMLVFECHTMHFTAVLYFLLPFVGSWFGWVPIRDEA